MKTLALALTSLLIAGTLQAGPECGHPEHDTAAAVLANAARSQSGLDEAVIVRLVQLGPDAICPVFGEFRSRGSGDAFGSRCLTALKRFPAIHIFSFVEGIVARTASPADAMAALEVLAELPGARSGRAALSVLEGLKPNQLASPTISAGLASRAAALLAADPAAAAVIEKAFPDLPREQKSLLIRAAESGGREPLLLRMLGPGAKGHEAEILRALGRIPTISPECHARYCPRLRRYLRGGDPKVRVAATRAVARMRDAESTPDLLSILAQEEEPILRRAAADALRRISGLTMRADASLWVRWEKAEAAWLANRYPALQRHLSEQKTGPVTNALREIGVHPRHQEKLQRAVMEHLGNSIPDIRRAACDALGSLGSPEALPKLVLMTRDRVPEVADAADRALRRITGVSPPPGRDWRKVLDLP